MLWTLRRLSEHLRLVLSMLINFIILIIDLLLILVPLTVLISAGRLHDRFVILVGWSWLRVEDFHVGHLVIASSTVVRMRSHIAFALLVNLREAVDILPDLLLVLVLSLPLTNIGQLCVPVDRKS